MTDIEKLKKLLNNISADLNSNEYICIATSYIEDGKEKYHYFASQSIEELIEIANNYKNQNLFVMISLSDGKGVEAENIVSSNIIGLDFDFKGKPKPSGIEFSKELREKFKGFIFAIVDSGHGYHVYYRIKKTDDVEEWHQTTKKLQVLLGADPLAVKKNQLLRLPTFYNYKYDEKVKSKSIYVSDCKPISLKCFNNHISASQSKEETRPYGLIRPCIERILQNGVNEGYRFNALHAIVPELKKMNLNYEEAKSKIIDFNAKCNPPENLSKVLDTFDYLFNAEGYVFHGCHSPHSTINSLLKQNCDGNCIFELKIPKKQTTLNERINIPIDLINTKNLKRLNGAEIALLIETYKNKELKKADIYAMFSRPTATKYIKHLNELKLIEITKKSIQIVKIKTKNTIEINSRISKLVINKKISKNEAKIYFMISFLEHINERTSETHISEMLNMDLGNVSKIIKALNDEGLICSSFNGFSVSSVPI